MEKRKKKFKKKLQLILNTLSGHHLELTKIIMSTRYETFAGLNIFKNSFLFFSYHVVNDV